jgi:branched-chain amino acid transport system permease protein
MLLFGGIGTLAGPIVGAAVLIIIREFLQALATYQVLVYGIFILIVLFFFPHGTVGVFNAVKKNIFDRFKRKKNHAHSG